jgi:hypothetical protein
VRDVPYIIPSYAQNVEAYRSDRFQGFVIDPDGLLELINRRTIVGVYPVK